MPAKAFWTVKVEADVQEAKSTLTADPLTFATVASQGSWWHTHRSLPNAGRHWPEAPRLEIGLVYAAIFLTAAI
jgi:hypothetical protein